MALFNFTFNIMAAQSQLEFVNIEVLKDNLIFLNGRAIADSNSTKYAKMRYKLANFSRETISILGNPNINQKRLGLNKQFNGLIENPYTRLGFCKYGISGNGVGNGKLKDLFINTLINSKAFSNGAISHINQFDLIIPNISVDRISDATSKVLAKELCEFTYDQCKKWHVGSKFIKGFSIEYYDDQQMDWKKGIFQLPFNVIDDIEVPIILIPKEFATDQYNSTNTLGHLFSYVISTLKTTNYFTNLTIPKTGKSGKSTLADYKGVFKKDKETKDALSNFLSNFRNNKILLNFIDERKDHIIGSLTDDEISNIVSSGVKTIRIA